MAKNLPQADLSCRGITDPCDADRESRVRTPAKFVNGSQSAGAINRRDFLKRSSTALVASTALLHAPYVFAKKSKPILRVMGTHVTLQEAIRIKAQEDLGIDIAFQPGGSAAVLQKAVARPDSFDLYEQWSNSIKVLSQANVIQPIEIKRLTHWSEINALTKTGKLTPDANEGRGDVPYKLLYMMPDGELSDQPTELISFLPYVHNVDSFGYNTQVIPRGIAYQTESWGWLLDDRWRGKVGLVNEPTIGLFDLALAAQAKGLMTFKDIGDMTRAELDTLFRILLEYKKSGHFSGIWSSVPQSIQFMKRGRVVIESMFSPAVSSLNGQGVPVVYAAPKEGYRAWHGVMCLSSQSQGRAKDVAYEYMNWWLSGWAGAFIARQGYYISNAERSKPYMSADEWDYWYAGEPAATDLPGTDGRVAVRAGAVRNGGSYEKRFSNIAVWNTVMDTYEYSLHWWHDFLAA